MRGTEAYDDRAAAAWAAENRERQREIDRETRTDELSWVRVTCVWLAAAAALCALSAFLL